MILLCGGDCGIIIHSISFHSYAMHSRLIVNHEGLTIVSHEGLTLKCHEGRFRITSQQIWGQRYQRLRAHVGDCIIIAFEFIWKHCIIIMIIGGDIIAELDYMMSC